MNIFRDHRWGLLSNGLLRPCHKFLSEEQTCFDDVYYNDDEITGFLDFRFKELPDQKEPDQEELPMGGVKKSRSCYAIKLFPSGAATTWYRSMPCHFSIYNPEEVAELPIWTKECERRIREEAPLANRRYWDAVCKSEPFVFQQVKLSSLIKGVYILVEPDEEDNYLVPFERTIGNSDEKDWSVHPRRIYDLYGTWLSFELSFDSLCGDRESGGQYDGTIKHSKGPRLSLEKNDIIGCRCGELITPSMLDELNDLSAYNPKFVVRPNLDRISMMYFGDLLRYSNVKAELSEKGESEYHRYFDLWQNIEVPFLEDRHEQLRFSLQLRNRVSSYRRGAERTLSFTSPLRSHDGFPPFSKILTNLERRTEIFSNPELVEQIVQNTSLTEIEEVRSLLKGGESETVEFKETLSLDVRTNTKEKYIELSALKTVVAFLNTKGGTLLLGIADDASVTGLQNEIDKFHKGNRDKFLLHFKNLLQARIGEDFYPYWDYKLMFIGECQILKVVCKQSDRPCYLDKADFYVRTNPATDKLEGPKLVKYVQNHFK